MAIIATYAQPTWLYRYRSIAEPNGGGNQAANRQRRDREIDALLQGFVYCSTFQRMNDPMEGFFRSSERVRNHPDYELFSQQVRDEKLGIGIASFSETWDNELMWAHYADAFRGICVVYSTTKLLTGLDAGHAFARVAYMDRPYMLNLSGMRSEERARAVLSTKNLKWTYEREWRLFAAAPGPATYDNDAVVSVFLGARMEAEHRRAITRRLRAAGIEVKRTIVKGYEVKLREETSGA